MKERKAGLGGGGGEREESEWQGIEHMCSVDWPGTQAGMKLACFHASCVCVFFLLGSRPGVGRFGGQSRRRRE